MAQEPGRDLDVLAKRLSKELTKSKIGSVVVADFGGRDGTSSMEGHYLANEFSERLEHYKKKFKVIDPKQLSSALSDAQLSANDLAEASSVQRIGGYLVADTVVTGILESTPTQYSVRVDVRRVKDGSVVASAEQTIKRPAYVDLLVLLGPGGPMPKIAKAGVDGIGIPTCVYCPAPNYTDKARNAKIEGSVVLLVVINEDGRAGRIAVTRANDDGLAIKAIEAVRKWQFSPAPDKGGKADAVLAPIEVTFRLN
ncbi:MAG: energy transducer TonB [Candidatus Acidiferrum sp.]